MGRKRREGKQHLLLSALYRTAVRLAAGGESTELALPVAVRNGVPSTVTPLVHWNDAVPIATCGSTTYPKLASDPRLNTPCEGSVLRVEDTCLNLADEGCELSLGVDISALTRSSIGLFVAHEVLPAHVIP